MTTPIPADVIGGPHQHVTEAELDAFLTRHLTPLPLDGKNVVLLVPDGTRSMPLPEVMRLLHRQLIGRVASLTAVIALGTHAYMTAAEIETMFGAGPAPDGQAPADSAPAPAAPDLPAIARLYPGLTVVNHEWADPSMIVTVGRLTEDDIERLSGGRMREAVDVEINRRVVEADYAIVVGPVFPHEVVGISGGNKYYVPGVATHEIIDLSHWVGALIGIDAIIGTRGVTPVRAIINAAAALIPSQRLALCLVVESGSGEIEAAAFGTPEDSWALASDVAAESHVVYLDQPVQRLLAIMPKRYADMWTAAKGCYKAQPAMAEGGEVVIYAPHITRPSEVHTEIEELGYHCIDYFIKQWDRFKDYPKGTLAHSTHVRGGGTYDVVTGVEHDRIRVTLATRIPKELCDKMNVGYIDPDTIDIEEWRRDPGTKVVDNAGEVLFRLK